MDRFPLPKAIDTAMIHHYFGQESNWGSIIILVGSFFLLLAIYVLIKKSSKLMLGFAIAVGLLGLVEVAVGTVIYVRSPKDVNRVEDMMRNDIGKIASEEIPRVQEVIDNFDTFLWLELIFITGGVLLVLFQRRGLLWRGVGAGLLLQGSFLLMVDYFAEARAVEYLEYLGRSVLLYS